MLTWTSVLSGDECPPKPLEAGSAAGFGSAVPLRHLPALLHPLRPDVRPSQRSSSECTLTSPVK